MASLGEFHHTEEAPNKGSRLVALIIIALLVGGAAIYAFESGMLNPGPQTEQNYPRGM